MAANGLRLDIYKKRQFLRSHTLSLDELARGVLVGRAPGADLRLEDAPGIAERQSLFLARTDGFRIRELSAEAHCRPTVFAPFEDGYHRKLTLKKGEEVLLTPRAALRWGDFVAICVPLGAGAPPAAAMELDSADAAPSERADVSVEDQTPTYTPRSLADPGETGDFPMPSTGPRDEFDATLDFDPKRLPSQAPVEETTEVGESLLSGSTLGIGPSLLKRGLDIQKTPLPAAPAAPEPAPTASPPHEARSTVASDGVQVASMAIPELTMEIGPEVLKAWSKQAASQVAPEEALATPPINPEGQAEPAMAANSQHDFGSGTSGQTLDWGVEDLAEIVQRGAPKAGPDQGLGRGDLDAAIDEDQPQTIVGIDQEKWYRQLLESYRTAENSAPGSSASAVAVGVTSVGGTAPPSSGAPGGQGVDSATGVASESVAEEGSDSEPPAEGDLEELPRPISKPEAPPLKPEALTPPLNPPQKPEALAPLPLPHAPRPEAPLATAPPLAAAPPAVAAPPVAAPALAPKPQPMRISRAVMAVPHELLPPALPALRISQPYLPVVSEEALGGPSSPHVTAAEPPKVEIRRGPGARDEDSLGTVFMKPSDVPAPSRILQDVPTELPKSSPQIEFASPPASKSNPPDTRRQESVRGSEASLKTRRTAEITPGPIAERVAPIEAPKVVFDTRRVEKALDRDAPPPAPVDASGEEDSGELDITLTPSASAPVPLDPKAKTYQPSPRLFDVSSKRIIPLISPILRLGRSEGMDLIVKDRSVSKHHATIHYADGIVTLTDQDSRNKTRIFNRTLQPLSPTTLRDGDLIFLGKAELVFMAGGLGHAGEFGDENLAESLLKSQVMSLAILDGALSQAKGQRRLLEQLLYDGALTPRRWGEFVLARKPGLNKLWLIVGIGLLLAVVAVAVAVALVATGG